jgi:tRNA pseudouridine55 synthase
MNIFAFYKPKGITSNDAVQMVKRLIGIRGVKIGHAGTLDPLAQGVLVIAVGREATKTINEVVKKEKEYIAEITLGLESATDDAEGIVLSQSKGDAEGEKTKIEFSKEPTIEEVKNSFKDFIGKIKQMPPIYSAIKISGKEAYKYARGGQVVEMESREVEIKSIELLDYAWPKLKIKVVTGPGVYIRSLARDIGRKLGVGGYLSFLERTRVGDFLKKDSVTEEKLSEFVKNIKI